MYVNIFYDDGKEDADIIELPQYLIDNLEDLQSEFFKWLFDKDNNHKYWIFENNQKKYCEYDVEAFVNWNYPELCF